MGESVGLGYGTLMLWSAKLSWGQKEKEEEKLTVRVCGHDVCQCNKRTNTPLCHVIKEPLLNLVESREPKGCFPFY